MRFQRKQTVHQLFLGHLETEYGDRQILPEGNVLRDIKYKRSLTHGRTRGDQDQIRPLQTGELIVKVDKAGRDSRDRSLGLGRLFDHIQGIEHDLFDRRILLRIPPLYQLEHSLLRLLQDILQGLILKIARIGNILIDLDQPAQDSLIPYDLRVILDIRRGLGSHKEFSCKLHAADLRRDILLLQVLLQCDQVHRFSLMKKFHDSVKKDPISCLIEILSGKHLRGDHDGILVHQHRPENSLFRLCTVGRHPFHCCFHIHRKTVSLRFFLHGNLQFRCNFRV